MDEIKNCDCKLNGLLEIDETCCNALYRAISSNSVDLFQSLMTGNETISNCREFQNLENALSRAYEKLKLINVILSPEMEFAVTRKLIELRFETPKAASVNRILEISLEDVKRRIETTTGLIEELRDTYPKTDDYVDEKFLCTARFIAQNINLLKRLLLKATYKDLPWEEIDFCLSIFIYSKTKPLEADISYSLILDKKKILKYLSNFAKMLSNQCIQKKDINSRARLSDRNSVISGIVVKHPELKPLYADYEIIRDIFSLLRMKFYIHSAVTNLDDKDKALTMLTIQRALQVIGEYFKDAPESPNLSHSMLRLFLYSAPKNIKTILTSLRDSLSHAQSLAKKPYLEELKAAKHVDFLQNVAKDMHKIIVEITTPLCNRKSQAIELFLNQIINCDCPLEYNAIQRELRPLITSVRGYMISTTQELIKVKNIAKDFRNTCDITTGLQLKLWDEIESRIRYLEKKPADALNQYELDIIGVNEILMCNVLRIAQNKARVYQHRIRRQQIQYQDIADYNGSILGNTIDENTSVEEVKHMERMKAKLYFAIEHGVGRVSTINDFKEYLDKQSDEDKKIAAEEIENIVAGIKGKLASDEHKKALQQKVDEKKEIHDEKLALIEFVNTDLNPDDVTKAIYRYKCLIPKLNLKSKKKEKVENILKQSKELQDLKDFRRLVSETEDSYGVFLKRLCEIGLMSSQKYIDSLETFFKSLGFVKRDVQLRNAVDEVKAEIEIKNERYYSERLYKLADLFIVYKDLQTILNNQPVMAAIEILMLELCELLENASLFVDNKCYMDGCCPLLIGKALRNYLAHGSILSDIMPYNSAIALVAHAKILMEKGVDLIRRQDTLIGQEVHFDNAVFNERYIQASHILNTQKNMFSAVYTGNLCKVLYYVDNGADINASGFDGCTLLGIATARDHLEIFKHFESALNISTQAEKLCRIAAASGSIRVFRYILSHFRLDFKRADEEGRTLIHDAAAGGNKNIVQILLDRNIDINAVGKLGATPLHVAIEKDQQDVVDLLLERGADVNYKNIYNRAPLHLAAEHGNEYAVQSLLNHGASVKAIGCWSELTALCLAVCAGHVNIVTQLLENGADVKSDVWHLAAQYGHDDVMRVLSEKIKVNVHIQDDCGRNALHFAAFFDHLEVVKLLIEYGIAINTKDNDGYTALHRASQGGNSVIVQELMKCDGVDVDAATVEGMTAPHFAALQPNGDIIVTLLVNRRANLNLKDGDGHTPLHLAAHWGRKRPLHVLLENGVDINAKTKLNITPLHLASLSGHIEVVNVLLNKNADVSIESVNGYQPLHYAAIYGSEATVLALLASNADIEAVTSNGSTALNIAVENGNFDIVKVLIRHNCNVNAQPYNNCTSLYMATLAGRKDMVDLLLKNNADVNLKSSRDWIPLHVAAAIGQTDIAKLLCEYGSDVNAKVLSDHTPVHISSDNGQVDTTRLLLEYGCYVDASDMLGRTPLHIAAAHDHTTIARLLIDYQACVNARTCAYYTPLHFAAIYGHVEMVTLLHDNGAETDAKCMFYSEAEIYRTTLKLQSNNNAAEITVPQPKPNVDIQQRNATVAVYFESDTKLKKKLDLPTYSEMVRTIPTLLDYRPLKNSEEKVTAILKEDIIRRKEAAANIAKNKRDISEYGKTALHLAVYHGRVDVIRALLEYRADVSIGTKGNWTVLHTAAQKGYLEIVRELIKNNANVNAALDSNAKYADLNLPTERSNEKAINVHETCETCASGMYCEGFTSLHCAAYEGHSGIVKELLEHGADSERRTICGKTPLNFARKKGHVNVVRTLLRYMPLHSAVEDGQEKVVQNLLKKGADVNAVVLNNSTPLHLAVRHGHVDIVRLLLRSQARCDMLDNDGNTPLTLAFILRTEDVKHKEVYDLLK